METYPRRYGPPTAHAYATIVNDDGIQRLAPARHVSIHDISPDTVLAAEMNSGLISNSRASVTISHLDGGDSTLLFTGDRAEQERAIRHLSDRLAFLADQLAGADILD
jgi:hypothetical protein